MKDKKETSFSMLDNKNQTINDHVFYEETELYFKKSIGTDIDKLRNFTKFVPRQNLSMFLAKNELFKKIITIHGDIIECGVFLGGGLMTWAQLSSIYEPYNHNRRVIGFDTFSGFPTINVKDKSIHNTDYTVEGGLCVNSEEDINESIRVYDLNRPIGHISRAGIIKGDALITIPEYIENNDHSVISLLYLDFDLYEPTKVAIQSFFPRMPKGAIIAFDELNQKQWPGETRALIDTIGINQLKIQRFSFLPQLSFAVLE
jgi:hypothetical protein